MSMFCFQCQETAKNEGCTVRGVCGKTDETANLQDLLIYTLKGISIYAEKIKELGGDYTDIGLFIMQSLFATITNANFDSERFISLIKKAVERRNKLRERFIALYKSKKGEDFGEELHDSAVWEPENDEYIYAKSKKVGVLSTEDEDTRSLREMVTYGLKGISAYGDHAAILGFEDNEIFDFLIQGLASTTKDLSTNELISLVLKTGEFAFKTMALLDRANSGTYGNPEASEVNIGVGENPGILISGHDLKDMEELLEQTEGTGVDVYTHGEMLPANYYPAFKKYKHFIGNYGGSWWMQNREFASFNGPILMTTNCIIPIKDSYKDRIFTTGMVGYPDVIHIPDRKPGGKKDFTDIIELARKCDPPGEIESGKIIGGFAHDQVSKYIDKILDAVKAGRIKRFIVMAGCDGRQAARKYYTEIAGNLPKDTVILTAGCAKYRYNKLELGEIDDIPRVLDAGQCNDSYSIAVIAKKLKEALGTDDINDLPISYDIAWYEQKAVAVLLSLLYLGIKGIRLGPTLPAFLSPNIAKVLVEKFDIKPISEVKEDIDAMMAGK
jgi:hydroxylamine reductase